MRDHSLCVFQFERVRIIYKYALDRIPKQQAQELFKNYTVFEKRFGDRRGIEDVIVSKRRFQYEEEVKVGKAWLYLLYNHLVKTHILSEYPNALKLYICLRQLQIIFEGFLNIVRVQSVVFLSFFEDGNYLVFAKPVCSFTQMQSISFFLNDSVLLINIISSCIG